MVRDFFKSEGVSLYGASLAPLSKTEEMKLAKLAANGDMQARETLIRANVRYVLTAFQMRMLMKRLLLG